MSRPEVQKQGVCVCEEQPSGGWLVMFPDGSIVHRSARAEADRACRAWFRDHVAAQKIGVALIQWRKA